MNPFVRVLFACLTTVLLSCYLPPLPNNRPDPPVITGPSEGFVDSTCTFTLLGRDPDSNNIRLRVSWGDADTSQWTPFIHSGETTQVTHSWTEPGTYTLRAQAMDWKDSVSDWSKGHCTTVFATECWIRTYGSTGRDEGYSIAQTSDGGYVVVGRIESSGVPSDILLVRLDHSGDTVWTKTFGGESHDVGHSVVVTSDGGFAVAGYTWVSDTTHADMYLVKTDEDGTVAWTLTIGGEGNDNGHSVVQTADGGFVVVGSTESIGAGHEDVYVVRATPEGDTIWTRTYGGGSADVGCSVAETSDCGFIVTGYTDSSTPDGRRVYVIRTDSKGDAMWTKTYGEEDHNCGYSVVQTSDMGFAVAGFSETSSVGEWGAWLLKIDADGDTLWSRTLGGTEYDEAYSVTETADGGLAVAGYTESHGAGSADAWLVRTDALGNEVWSRTYGGQRIDEGRCVIQASDGGFAVAGYTTSFGSGGCDFYVVKTDPYGNSHP
jgi:hypothetical protein